MFIGGLNWDTTDGAVYTYVIDYQVLILYIEGLREYFTQFGKVDACTIMRDPTGRSRCFAFLTFEDPASVNAVMVREHHLDGKIVSRSMPTLSSTSVNASCVFDRLTLSVRFPVKNTIEHKNCLLVVWRLQLPLNRWQNSSRSLARLSIRR